jgi:hypothetical protein
MKMASSEHVFGVLYEYSDSRDADVIPIVSASLCRCP